ncbi:MAG TPA: helix-turn-helix domain-containing protein [Chitinophaga sp.]|uniref:AraC family transcriptional regulator n=1 Tax=Chitinophaga sp. TaxID=1869181 RepID=UPI002CFF60CA|nr:helix-turn-helix domain-containing protein [Chitinophaga sp.]HVI47727.1 helix-turn-helix domain-containing protein [Chitinophaga sp.]
MNHSPCSKIFAPVQPAACNAADVRYMEVPPHAGLQGYIYCYWQLSTPVSLVAPFSYHVVADGCIDIYFETADPANIFIKGFSSVYTAFPLPAAFNYTGIRFLPAAFPLLYNINAATLTGRDERLKDVLPRHAAGITDVAQRETSLAAIAFRLDEYFLKQTGNSKVHTDGRVWEAIDNICSSKGLQPLKEATDTGISPRQLRRLFEFYVGDTPKVFSKVIRFQHFLHARPSAASIRQHKSFFDAGYSDQAHFIKEFKTMYGLTPTAAPK